MMIDLSKTQTDLVAEYAYGRYALLTAFRMNLEGEIPEGNTKLARGPAVRHSEELYVLDAKVCNVYEKSFLQLLHSRTSSTLNFRSAWKELSSLVTLSNHLMTHRKLNLTLWLLEVLLLGKLLRIK